MPRATAARASASRSPPATRTSMPSDRVVATVGVENLVIIDTPDAVLVAHRDHLQRVQEVVGELKARGHEAYRLHTTVTRPWGAYTVLQEGPGFKIKRIEVKPGAALSLQLHHRRSEHWVVVAGIARRDARRGDVFAVGSQRIDVHPGRDEAPPREPRDDAARHDRGAVRRLSRRGRHRPLRRPVRARAAS